MKDIKKNMDEMDKETKKFYLTGKAEPQMIKIETTLEGKYGILWRGLMGVCSENREAEVAGMVIRDGLDSVSVSLAKKFVENMLGG